VLFNELRYRLRRSLCQDNNISIMTHALVIGNYSGVKRSDNVPTSVSHKRMRGLILSHKMTNRNRLNHRDLRQVKMVYTLEPKWQGGEFWFSTLIGIDPNSTPTVGVPYHGTGFHPRLFIENPDGVVFLSTYKNYLAFIGYKLTLNSVQILKNFPPVQLAGQPCIFKAPTTP
jgi:hypothetical protein